AEEEAAGEQERDQNAVVDFQRVDDPEGMQGTEQAGEGADEYTARRPPREEKVKPGRQHAEGNLRPANGPEELIGSIEHPVQQSQQPGVARRGVRRALLSVGERGERAPPAVFLEVLDEGAQLVVGLRRWLIPQQNPGRRRRILDRQRWVG